MVDSVFLSFSFGIAAVVCVCVKQLFPLQTSATELQVYLFNLIVGSTFCNKFKIQIQLIHWFIVECDAVAVAVCIAFVNTLDMALEEKIHNFIRFMHFLPHFTECCLCCPFFYVAAPSSSTTSARFFWGPITFIPLIRSWHTHSVKQKKLIFFFELARTHRHSLSISVTEQSEIFYYNERHLRDSKIRNSSVCLKMYRLESRWSA